MHKVRVSIALSLVFALCASVGYAEIIGINFIGSAGASGTLGSGDFAGLTGSEGGNTLGSTFAANWNNLASNIGSSSSLINSAGNTVSGLGVSWTADNTFELPDVTGGSNLSGGSNPAMMKGYLDNGNSGTITVSVSGLAYDTYSVVVYIDGENGELWRRSSVTINDGTAYNTILEDSEYVNFNSGSGNNANGLFQLPSPGGVGGDWPVYPENNSEANVIIFTGLTGSNFTLTSVNSTYLGDFGRAPINAIQIVGVPEPVTMTLLIMGGGLYLMRKKRNS